MKSFFHVYFIGILSIIFHSCTSTPLPNNPQAPSIPKANSSIAIKRVPIDSSGFSIELPSSMKITNQKGDDFMVYYFTPIDTTSTKGEGGIYFGPKPDEHPPTSEYTKSEMLGIFLGQSVKWTVYTTAKYTQREVFVDERNGRKIHAWCYADNAIELEKLFKMICSIAR